MEARLTGSADSGLEAAASAWTPSASPSLWPSASSLKVWEFSEEVWPLEGDRDKPDQPVTEFDHSPKFYEVFFTSSRFPVPEVLLRDVPEDVAAVLAESKYLYGPGVTAETRNWIQTVLDQQAGVHGVMILDRAGGANNGRRTGDPQLMEPIHVGIVTEGEQRFLKVRWRGLIPVDHEHIGRYPVTFELMTEGTIYRIRERAFVQIYSRSSSLVDHVRGIAASDGPVQWTVDSLSGNQPGITVLSGLLDSHEEGRFWEPAYAEFLEALFSSLKEAGVDRVLVQRHPGLIRDAMELARGWQESGLPSFQAYARSVLEHRGLRPAALAAVPPHLLYGLRKAVEVGLSVQGIEPGSYARDREGIATFTPLVKQSGNRLMAARILEERSIGDIKKPVLVLAGAPGDPEDPDGLVGQLKTLAGQQPLHCWVGRWSAVDPDSDGTVVPAVALENPARDPRASEILLYKLILPKKPLPEPEPQPEPNADPAVTGEIQAPSRWSRFSLPAWLSWPWRRQKPPSKPAAPSLAPARPARPPPEFRKVTADEFQAVIFLAEGSLSVGKGERFEGLRKTWLPDQAGSPGGRPSELPGLPWDRAKKRFPSVGDFFRYRDWLQHQMVLDKPAWLTGETPGRMAIFPDWSGTVPGTVEVYVKAAHREDQAVWRQAVEKHLTGGDVNSPHRFAVMDCPDDGVLAAPPVVVIRERWPWPEDLYWRWQAPILMPDGLGGVERLSPDLVSAVARNPDLAMETLGPVRNWLRFKVNGQEHIAVLSFGENPPARREWIRISPLNDDVLTYHRDAIQKLLRQLYGTDDGPGETQDGSVDDMLAGSVLRLLSETEPGFVALAEMNGAETVVGLVFDNTTANGAHQYDLIVHPEWRERGVGRRLLEEAVASSAGLESSEPPEPSLPLGSEELFRQAGSLEKIGKMQEAFDVYVEALRRFPDAPAVLKAVADVFILYRFYTEAIRLYQKAVEVNPSYVHAWMNLASVQLRAGRYEEAARSLEEAVRLDPDEPSIWSNAVHVYGALGKHEQAIAAGLKATRMKPSDFKKWINLGVAYSLAQRHAEALDSYQRAVRLEPRAEIAWTNLAQCHQTMGDLEAALHAASKALRLDRDNGLAWELYLNSLHLIARAKRDSSKEGADLALWLDQVDGFITRWSDLSSAARDNGLVPVLQGEPQFLSLVGTGHSEDEVSRRFKALGGVVVAIYETGISGQKVVRQPELPLLRLEMHFVPTPLSKLTEAQRREMISEMLKLLESSGLESSEPPEPSSSREDRELFGRALRLAQQGQWQRALDIYADLLQRHPGHPDISNNLANIYLHFGLHEKASELYRAAIETHPGDVAAWRNLGVSQFLAGRYDDALNSFEAVIRLKPEDADAWSNAVLIYVALGRHEEAIAAGLKAVELEPRDPSNWINLGLGYVQAGRKRDAISPFERAVKLAPAMLTAWNNLANCQLDVGDIASARHASMKGLQIDPRNEPAWRTYIDSLRREARAKRDPGQVGTAFGQWSDRLDRFIEHWFYLAASLGNGADLRKILREEPELLSLIGPEHQGDSARERFNLLSGIAVAIYETGVSQKMVVTRPEVPLVRFGALDVSGWGSKVEVREVIEKVSQLLRILAPAGLEEARPVGLPSLEQREVDSAV